jgi:WhiB family transcriptional regulator, redox-sensing transcriptional regulator
VSAAALSAAPAGWRQRAACAQPQVDLEWFFPEQGRSARRARRICARCPVQAPCLADALATPAALDDGIRAGTTAGERRPLRNRAR